MLRVASWTDSAGVEGGRRAGVLLQNFERDGGLLTEEGSLQRGRIKRRHRNLLNSLNGSKRSSLAIPHWNSTSLGPPPLPCRTPLSLPTHPIPPIPPVPPIPPIPPLLSLLPPVSNLSDLTHYSLPHAPLGGLGGVAGGEGVGGEVTEGRGAAAEDPAAKGCTLDLLPFHTSLPSSLP
eukprot:1020180-Rhodomonas_salina.1